MPPVVGQEKVFVFPGFAWPSVGDLVKEKLPAPSSAVDVVAARIALEAIPPCPATGCTNLFTYAVAPANSSTTSTPGVTFAPATDVLQAAYYIFTNPTNSTPANLAQLYNLSPAGGAPYQPTLTTVPSDWSIGIRYVASGSCGSASSNGFISFPKDINIDATGNVWIANGQPQRGTLSELSPTGQPQVCIPIPGGSKGGTIDSGILSSGPNPTRSANNIWIGDSENNFVYRYNPVSPATLAFPTAAPPYAMAADGNGNVYFSTFNPVGVWMIPGASTAGAPVTPIQISNVVGSASRILVDGNGSIWASSLLGFVSQITPTSDPASTNFLNGYTTVQYTTPSPSYGLAAGPGKAPGNNGIYVSSQATANQIDLLAGTGITYAAAPGFPTASGAGGLNVPSAIAVDGALNSWAANDQPNARTGLSLVTEISAAGVSLSPEGGFQKDATFFLNGRSIAVDQAGNVWIGSDGANFVTEIVGGAVPIYQPFALGLSNGRFQLKP